MLGAIELANAVPRIVTLQPPGFAITEEAIEEALQQARGPVKMIVLNTPHNPTGTRINVYHGSSFTSLQGTWLI